MAAKVYSLFVVIDVVLHSLSTAGTGNLGPDCVPTTKVEYVRHDFLQIRLSVALQLRV